MAQIELPPKYYLTNFWYLLDFVQKKSMPLLQERELNFIRLFQTLSEDAQCLFIRFVNRRKIFFKTKQLRYAEIADIPNALNELIEKQFISSLLPEQEDKILFLLEIFTKNELMDIIGQTGEKPNKQAKKSALTLWILEHLPFQQLIPIIAQKEEIIKQEFEAEVEFLLYLFFGNLEMDMTRFVIRDLGHVQYEQFSEEKYTSFFKSRKEAEDKLKMEKAYQHFGFLSVLYSAQELYDWFMSQIAYWQYLHESAQRLFDKLCLDLGKLLEKSKLDQEALKVYQYTSKPPSMERQVRLLYKLGFEQEALILCKKLEIKPLSPEEKLFAIDFREKLEKQKGKSTRTTTQWLKQAESISIDSFFQSNVELGALEHFKNQGFEGLFTENYLWNALFGVLFWDIIFDENQDAIHHPFQLAPSDLMREDFWEKRQDKLLARTAILENEESFLTHIQEIITYKQGRANPFVFWHEDLLFHLTKLYDLLDSDQIGIVLLEIAKNIKEYSKGFPDLFIWNSDTYYFVEVKSPNDHLSAHQVFWLSFFQEVGINAKVLRVSFL
ncbi:VRR-NUC domain-containing protein [Thermoflexibacter ruber]|uniref:phosphodiesterase I n=1 Tax=Thermoflexibacter ruber TaxID=1003 RepID=A0A1I2JR36_9BACT|nr:VRR-NUC domain-containing protein [Thermoflexibacter ruber]SFF57044.1 VRR-NUC domain-containing protein [Thermoflexibacter ruber]